MRDGGIEPRAGRRLFGQDAARYERGRPPYPDRVFGLLEECVRPTARVLEIGAGSGLATARLAALGAASVTALEPDERFAPALRAIRERSASRVDLVFASFEEADLAPRSFDLVAAATSFHWIPQVEGLARAAAILRPGGTLALWWNVFGDPERPDPFHDATEGLLRGLHANPSHPRGASAPFALDADSRIADLEASGAFGEIHAERVDWTLALDPEGVRLLYGTYSSIAELDDATRSELLDELVAIARIGFGGRVERNMVTPIYLARRTPDTPGAG